MSKDYFKIIKNESTGVGEILLYGSIGEDFWSSEEGITDISFIKELRSLETNHKRINIRINSGGGSMYHGNAIVTAIQSSKVEIHAYNDGLAASMASSIWMACPNRHMAKNSLLMIHCPSGGVFGTASDMRETADILDKFEHTAIVVMSEATGMSQEKVKDDYFDYEDHWLTAEDVKKLNLITEVESYTTKKTPKNATKMNAKQISDWFAKEANNNNQMKQETSTSILNKLSSIFMAADKGKKDEVEKTAKELKEELDNAVAESTKLKSELEASNTENADLKNQISTLTDKVASLESENSTLKTQVETLQSESTKEQVESAQKEEKKKEEEATLSAKMDGFAATMKALEEKFGLVKAENEGLKKDKETLTASVAAKTKEVATAKAETAKKTAELKAQTERTAAIIEANNLSTELTTQELAAQVEKTKEEDEPKLSGDELAFALLNKSREEALAEEEELLKTQEVEE